MHRKPTKEQNDISMILGTLPKRLQQKFVEDSYIVENDGHDAIGASKQIVSVGKGRDEDKAPKTGCERKTPNRYPNTTDVNSITHVVDSNGCKNAFSIKGQKRIEKNADAAVVPGILRLNVSSDTKKLNVPFNDKSKIVRPKINKKEGLENHLDEISVKTHLSANISPQESPQKQIWFHELDQINSEELSRLNKILEKLIQTNSIIQNWECFISTHCKFRCFYAQLLLNQLKFCCERKVDTFFWKLLFYNIRQNLKIQKSIKASDCILALLDIGLQFYTDIYAQLNLKFLAIPNFAGSQDRQSRKLEAIAKIMAQKVLIWLGDLSRYKTRQKQSTDFYDSTLYYQRAVGLIPTNGKPYNQLAVIAIQAHKQFDAVYFHMRSLMSSNPIESAKESLLVLFDDIRKNYEETERKRSPLHIQQKNQNSNSKPLRREVWVNPSGERCVHQMDLKGSKATSQEETLYQNLPIDELQHRFTNLYLYLIGKLYTGVGLEDLYDYQKLLVMQLGVILKKNQIKLNRSKIQKIAALNIFVLDRNMRKGSRREVRYYAFNFCNDIFGLIVRVCNHFFNLYLESFSDFTEQSFWDLNTLLQFIKIYTDWLSRNLEVWEPIRSEDHSFTDCWSELQQIFSLINCALQRQNDHDKLQQSLIALEEDEFLAGFTPLDLGMNSEEKYRINTKNVQFYARITKIFKFQNCFLSNQMRLKLTEKSPFVLDDLNTVFKTELRNNLDTKSNENNGNVVIDRPKHDVQCNGFKKLSNGIASATGQTDNINNQISELSKLKRELEQKTHEKKMYNEKLEEILRFVDTKLLIEVRPKFLLPDTNCFIDCLEDIIKLIMEYKIYTLMIPLTVVKELDGLSKGVKIESYEISKRKQRIHHFDDVSTRAKKSLDFLKASRSNVKCVTTKGSIINASLFALVEEENVSNDDKILATALALSKTLSTETVKDDKCFIQTELVLITTDRNLRVKALSRNLAVSELNEFLQWAAGSRL